MRVSEVTLFGDMDCYKIETPTATYLYGKRGAGFASILDPSGHDWISYRHGGKALGEYRGLPKCGQPVKYFHCGYGYGQYTNTNWFTSTILERSPRHIRIRSETQGGDSACVWDFYPNSATMNLERIGNPTYWFLYEGTPGGGLDPADDFVLRPDGIRTALTEPWTGSVSWVCFGAMESRHGLLLINQQNPEPGQPDSYVSWPYRPEPDGSLNQMTVFGFGRPGWQDPKQHTPPLNRLPARFTIAVTPNTDYEAVRRLAESLRSLSSSR